MKKNSVNSIKLKWKEKFLKTKLPVFGAQKWVCVCARIVVAEVADVVVLSYFLDCIVYVVKMLANEYVYGIRIWREDGIVQKWSRNGRENGLTACQLWSMDGYRWV